MENDDLKNLWNGFNRAIENAEKTNRQILRKIIAGKSETRLLIMKFQSVLGILITPLIIVLVVVPMIVNIEMTIWTLTGIILVTGIFTYFSIQAFFYYKLLNLIRPALDPVIRIQEGILKLQKFMLRLQKMRNLLYPLTASSFVLISWDRIHYELPVKIVLLTLITVSIFFWGNFKYRLYFHDRINFIKLEINELEDYK